MSGVRPSRGTWSKSHSGSDGGAGGMKARSGLQSGSRCRPEN
ncbi:hypothetical protein [Gorillibacterium sp. sgz5001074]